MQRISKLAFGAALALGGVALVAAPGLAQKKKKEEAAAQASPNQPSLKNLTKEERTALLEVQKALDAKDTATATTALAAAMPVVTTGDGRFLVGSSQVRIGMLTKDLKLQLEGVEGMLASGSAPTGALPGLLGNQVALATELKDNAKAEAALTRLMQIDPNNTETIILLAQLRANQNQVAEALSLIDKAMAAEKAAGKQVPESWYKFAVARGNNARLVPQTVKFSRAWLTDYPTTQNWRDSLILYRKLVNPERQTLIDVYRLLRLQKGMNGEGDYYMLANALNQTGYPGEVMAVLDEGIAAKQVNPSKEEFKLLMAAGGRVAADKASLPAGEKSALAAATGVPAQKTADAYFGYGDYAKAVTLYRAALQKGSVDANLVNTRLGMALAMTGDKAGAEAAFKAVGGPRADLGAFLLLWLSQRA
jgi:tetratricopeptide (TPR) repeat protein